MHHDGSVYLEHLALELCWLTLPGARRPMWWWQSDGRRVWGVFAGDA